MFANRLSNCRATWRIAAGSSRPAAALSRSSTARFSAIVHDPIWEGIYLPIAGAVDIVAGRLNRLQFLTIRLYLTLVFLALVILLLVLAIWP